MHISYAPQFPWALHAFGHSAAIKEIKLNATKVIRHCWTISEGVSCGRNWFGKSAIWWNLFLWGLWLPRNFCEWLESSSVNMHWEPVTASEENHFIWIFLFSVTEKREDSMYCTHTGTDRPDHYEWWGLNDYFLDSLEKDLTDWNPFMLSWPLNFDQFWQLKKDLSFSCDLNNTL